MIHANQAAPVPLEIQHFAGAQGRPSDSIREAEGFVKRGEATSAPRTPADLP